MTKLGPKTLPKAKSAPCTLAPSPTDRSRQPIPMYRWMDA